MDEVCCGGVKLAEVIESGGEGGGSGFESAADFGLDEFALEIVEGLGAEPGDKRSDVAVRDLEKIVLDALPVECLLVVGQGFPTCVFVETESIEAAEVVEPFTPVVLIDRGVGDAV